MIKKLLLIASIAAIAVAAFVFSGVYDVGADNSHWALTHRIIETTRERSIASRAADIEVPQDLNDPERARRGAGNYNAMCVGCHLKPGRTNSELRRGLYPQPPNLALADDDPDAAKNRAAKQFWVIKHGLKASAMPAWSKGGVDDATIWDMVALLQKLPAMTQADYRGLVAASNGHSHSAGHAADGDDHHDHHHHDHEADEPDLPSDHTQ